VTEEQKLAELLVGPVKPKNALKEPDPTEELETVGTPETAAPTASSAASSAVTLSNLFRHPDAHPVVLDLCLLRKYGPDWYAWEPETLELRIPQDFHVVDVSDLTLSKIQACKTIHLVDTYWQQWEIFLWCTMSLNGIFPDFDTMQVPTVAQCAVSVEIANQLRDDVEWSSEVKTYLSMVHRHDGIFVPQAPLDFVHVDSEGFQVDPKEIKLLWPAVRASQHAPTADTVTAEQLRRMLTVHKAVEANRHQLRTQLPLVQHV